MATGFIHSDRFLDHVTSPGHPERPDRLRSIVRKLQVCHLWDRLEHLPFGPADLRWIKAVHPGGYVDHVKEACESGLPCLDAGDTSICPASYDVAVLGVGGILSAVDAVMSGRVQNAFCAVRPPGHHAEPNRAMGFCLFSNVAIAAEYLIKHHGLQRVAIVDFDVHHGNGTQAVFYSRSDVLFISLHEHPSYQYPGTGFPRETGEGPGLGYTLNVAFPSGAGDEHYRAEIKSMVLPALHKFRPEALILSAGFDASAEDPLGRIELSPSMFAWMTRQFKAVAEEHAGGRLISCLEGGYDLQSLAECVALHVGSLLQPEGQDELMAMKAGL